MEKLILDKLKLFKNKYKDNHQNLISNLFENMVIKLNKTKLNDEGYTKLNNYIDAIIESYPTDNKSQSSLTKLGNYFYKTKLIHELFNKCHILSSKQIKDKNNVRLLNIIENYEYALIKNDEIVLLFTSLDDVFKYLYTKEYKWVNNRFIDSLKE